MTYAKGFHVDLVCYAWFDDANGIERHQLAHKTNGWRNADPPGLVNFVANLRKPFASTEDSTTRTDQFRRVARILKRWNDLALPGESNDKPTGLALVLLVGQYLLSPSRNWDGEANDLDAVLRVSRTAADLRGRIVIVKPTPEGEDMFGRLSASAMIDLKERFGALAHALASAAREPQTANACRLLVSHLGDDFPVSSAVESARKSSGPAIITSSSSA